MSSADFSQSGQSSPVPHPKLILQQACLHQKKMKRPASKLFQSNTFEQAVIYIPNEL